MKNYFLFLFAILFILIPVSAVRPMTSLFAEDLGASVLEIGVITAFYSIMPIFIAIVTGRFIDKFGEKLPLVLGTIGVTLALILPYLIPELYMLYICLILLGGSQFLALVSVQNGIAKFATSGVKQDKAIGTFSLFTSIGNTIGPLIGGFVSEHRGFQDTYFILSIISIVSLVCGILVIQKKSQTDKKNIESISVKKIVSIKGLKRIIIVSMINLAALDLFYVYYPLYANSQGFSPSKIGLIIMFMALASVIARLFLATAVLKFGRVRVLFAFMLMGAIAYSFIPVFDGFSTIIIVVMILGAGLGMSQPLTILLTYQFAPKNHTAEVLGLRLAGNRLSQVVSPIIFAGVSSLVGLGSIFVIEAILLGFGAFFSLGLDKQEKTKSQDST
ncbi:MFS transporter [Oceanobacillus saliphilus]|uniref:MFS transporter n=1 Tax=Oceanobacillus saliphilus TaxID=2925834 RepID=UPI00201D5B34|nr:MFS transporter [Oceanobacillus saliphilus]